MFLGFHLDLFTEFVSVLLGIFSWATHTLGYSRGTQTRPQGVSFLISMMPVSSSVTMVKTELVHAKGLEMPNKH